MHVGHGVMHEHESAGVNQLWKNEMCEVSYDCSYGINGAYDA